MAVKTFNISAYNTGWGDISNAFTKNADPVYLYPNGNWADRKSEWQTTLGGADHYAIVKIQLGGTGATVGGLCRCQGDASNTCYSFYLATSGSYIFRYQAGSASVVSSDTATTFSEDTDYYVGMDVSGSGATVTVHLKWGTSDPPDTETISFGDTHSSRVTAGNYGGVFGRNNGATATDCKIFEGKGDTGTIPAVDFPTTEVIEAFTGVTDTTPPNSNWTNV